MNARQRNFAAWTLALLASLGTNGRSCAAETPSHPGLKICVAADVPVAIRTAADAVLAACKDHPLLRVLAGERPPATVCDTQALLAGPAASRALDHLVLVGLTDDPLIRAAWQREARAIPGGLYVFGFGNLTGELGYLESDRNPFLHSPAIDKTPYETEVITLCGTSSGGVAAAVHAFLQQGLINGVVAPRGFRRGRPTILQRDPLLPDFSLPEWIPDRSGDAVRVGVTQAGEDEYRGVLEDTGVLPQAIWRLKYHRPGAWDGGGERLAMAQYMAGLHRRAYGNTLWTARFAAPAEAEQAAAKIAAAAHLTRQGASWQGTQMSYGFDQERPGALSLARGGAWLILSTLPTNASAIAAVAPR